MVNEIKDWCAGKNPWWRIGLLLLLAYIGIRSAINPMESGLFGAITLGVHEAGHIIFEFFGEFLHVAGGTLMQLAAPIICTIMFFRQPDYFAPVLSGVWLATSLCNVSVYIADAVHLELPLVSVGGGEVYHDWEYMLSALNILSLAEPIAFAVKVMWYCCLLGSLIYGVWIIWLMMRPQK